MLLPQMIAAVAARCAARVAVEVPEDSAGSVRPASAMTYGALVDRAAQLAAVLAPRVEAEDRVVVLLPRHHPDAVAAQLAVWWVAGAFVCPDPRHPDAALHHVVRDSGAVAALSDRDGAARLAPVVERERVLVVDDLGPCASSPAPAPLTASSLAYVLYTSGTTGRPKGVLVEHGGLANLVRSDVERFGLGEGDRCLQGSSLAYDSSLEEIWSPLAGGATVVVADDERIRGGPDLVAWLRAQRITVVMPTPTLLRTLGVREPARELPDLRLIYTGGEAVPDEVVDLWADAVWLENGYGPTECTVVCTRGRLRRGEPVTIGRPIPGHDAFVLDPDGDAPVARGEIGELCIRGPGVARGYMGDPDRTSARFPVLEGIGRVYRTGDLARWSGDALVCLGRVDGQVKVRGYRIELEAIEQALVTETGARAAACRVQGATGREQIVGFVVGAEHVDRDAIRAQLGRMLPAHMVPAAVGTLDALPMNASGKLDRSGLPVVDLAGPEAKLRPPRSAREKAVEQAFARALGMDRVSVDADFFDLGGNSVRAAEAVSLLRQDPTTAHLAVRDLYEAPTVERLAALAEERRDRQHSGTEPAGGPAQRAVGAPRPFLALVVQTLWLWGEAVVGAAALWFVLFVGLGWALERASMPLLLLAAPLALGLLRWVWAAVAVVMLVGAKWLFVGRYRALRTPAWSPLFVRFWIVERFAARVPWGTLQGTVLIGFVLRLLGAKVGRRVHVHRGVDLTAGGWDLLEIGDDATLGQGARLGLMERRAGHVELASVRVGAEATLEVRAGIDGGSALEPRAELGPSASLRAGQSVPAGRRAEGVPARVVGPASTAPESACRPGGAAALWHGVVMLIRVGLVDLLLAVPIVWLGIGLWEWWGIPDRAAADWFAAPFSEPGLVVSFAGLAVLGTGWWVWALGLALRHLVAPVPPGTHDRWGPRYGRVWLRTGFVQRANRWLSGSLLWPLWLRLAGARIGPDCEVSTVVDLLPESAAVGATSFFADGIYLAGPRVSRGVLTTAATSMGRESFVGNHAVIPAGTELPDRVLLGVSTVVDPRAVGEGSSWFGLPAFELPRREVVEMERSQTHEPGAFQVARRWAWELLRFALPAVGVLAGFAVLALVGSAGASWPGATGFLVALPLCLAAVGASLAVLVLGLKWLLLGRVRPGQHGLWSGWCCRWDFVYVAWGYLAQPVLRRFGGTLLLGWYLRAMGMRIGRRVLLGPSFAQVVDPDMLDLGDGATCDAMFQAHSFEDRVLKIDRVRLGRGCTVRPGAVVLYGAEIGDGSEVAAHGVVMKRERLPAGQRFDGAPTRPVGSAQ